MRVRQLLEAGVAEGAYPAAVLEVGREQGVSWRHAAGRLTYEPGAAAASEETVFDLASLTKVIVTTTLAMQLVDRQALRLSDPVSSWLPGWRGRDRAHVRVRDLLEHCSGLTAWMPFYRDQQGRPDMAEAICALPLEYPPWTRSDLQRPRVHAARVHPRGCDRHTSQSAVRNGCRGAGAALWRAGGMARTNRADRNRSLAGSAAVWRGARRERLGARRCGGACGPVRDGAGRGRVRAPRTGDVSRRHRSGAETRRSRDSSRAAPCPAARARWGGTRCCRTSSCGTRLSDAPSGTPASPARRSGSIPQRDLYIVLLTNRVHPTRDNPRLGGAAAPRCTTLSWSEFG